MRIPSRLIAVVAVLSWSTVAWAGPAAEQAPSSPEAPQETSDSDAKQQGQTQGQGPSSQDQSLGPPPEGGQGPTITVQPQIQVQVQPQVDVEAKPQADAGADAGADADADANANAEGEVDAAGVRVAEGPQAVPSTPQTRQRVIHRPYSESFPPSPRTPVRQTKRRKGLMIAGIVTFGAVYAGTAYNAARLYDNCETFEEEARCRRLSKAMFIPVAGPFMAIPEAESATNVFKLSLMGAGQSAGVLMGVIGTALFIRDGYRNRILNEHGLRVAKHRDVRLGPVAGADRAGVSLRYRF